MAVRSAASVEACPWTTSSPCSVTSLADTVEVSVVLEVSAEAVEHHNNAVTAADLRVKVKLTSKEISTGVEKKFKLKKYVPCAHCHGTGAEGDGGAETCPTCKGSGSVIRNQQTILGTMQTRTTCPTCGGEGKIIKNKCKKCAGEGIIYGEEVVSVNIPTGVAEGMQLSMGGKGNAGKHNGVPGDLLILVEEEQHQNLIRDENDLIYNLLLSFPTAAWGGAVEIPTIDGKVKVKIDSGTQPGKVLRLRGKGLPNVNGYGTGDLLVNISVYVPETLNKEEKRARGRDGRIG